MIRTSDLGGGSDRQIGLLPNRGSEEKVRTSKLKARAALAAVAAGAVVLAISAGGASAKPLFQLDSHVFAQPPTTAQCEAAIGIACYNPGQLQHAYGTDQLYARNITGRGETIVIVDSYGSPTIQNDLAQFDADNGLPAPPAFNIIQPEGPVPPYNPAVLDQGGWAIETSLDVEYSHAIAPDANILLVETPVDETEGLQGLPQMMQAERYVIDHHMGDVITQSFGATELTFQNTRGHFDPFQIYGLRYAFQDAAAHGITVLAASGDAGSTDYEPDQADLYPFRTSDWPSTDPLVTSLGGTQLNLDQFGNRTAPDNVWNDQALFGSPAAGSGGLSYVFGRPTYQASVAGTVGFRRGVPDVSMSAAVNGGVNVYLSVNSPPEGITSPGYYIIGGTSEASPLFSGIVALADQVAGHPIGQINPRLYTLGDGPGSGITDITSGNNTVTFTNSNGVTYTVPGFNAVPGYDLASGLGTAYAPALVFQLAAFSH
jgi:subtilase family serine protease